MTLAKVTAKNDPPESTRGNLDPLSGHRTHPRTAEPAPVALETR